MLKRINDALPGLVAGILLYGVVVQLIGVWFVENKLGYSIGLWYGIAIAIGMAINMAMVIYDTVTMDGEIANNRSIAKSILRYAIVVVLFFILAYFDLGNLFSAFLGVMGLKVGAYMQPLLHKLINKLLGRSDASSTDEDSENTDKEVTL